MEKPNTPRPLASGVIYAECAFWIALLGLCVCMTGMIGCFAGGRQFFDIDAQMTGLWAGKNSRMIWQEAAGSEVLPGHWFLGKLRFADGIAALGMAITCVAGFVGAWGALVAMLVRKEKPRVFQLLALALALILTASAAGLLTHFSF